MRVSEHHNIHCGAFVSSNLKAALVFSLFAAVLAATITVTRSENSTIDLSCSVIPTIIAPEPIVGFSGQTVHFDCIVCIGSTLFWVLDNKDARTFSDSELKSSISSTYSGERTVKSQLTFIAAPTYINHTVACLVVVGDEIELSEEITLPVQGVLEAPVINGIVIKDGSITVTWTPPSSLVPITNYTIVVNNNEPYELIISEPATSSTLNATVSLTDINRCTNQEIRLFLHANNPSGPGENGTVTVTIPADRKLCNSYVNVNLSQMTIGFVVFASVFSILIIAAALLSPKGNSHHPVLYTCKWKSDAKTKLKKIHTVTEV